MTASQPAAADGPDAPARQRPAAVARLHLRWGWTMILLFALLGMGLEALHGFKVGWYLDVGNETRRLMFRLGHAHGTLLGLLNLGLAFTVTRLPDQPARQRMRGSRALRVASILMPGGFVAGGWVVHGGDPGLGVLLVPLGGVALIVALATTAWATRGGVHGEGGGAGSA